MSVFNNISEGAIIARQNHNITMCNMVARILFDITEDEIIGWRVTDLLKNDDHLLEAYYETINRKSIIREIMNTSVTINRRKAKEKVAINFRCFSFNSTENDCFVLLLFQQIS